MKRTLIVLAILVGILALPVLGLAGGILLNRQLLASTGGQDLVSLVAGSPPAPRPT
jgi:hypothetical protein